MVLSGNFISTAITQEKEIAKPLVINMKAVESVMKYSEILRQAPERIVSWKASYTQAGARMELSMVKAHYDNADIDTVTSGFPDVDDDGQKIDRRAIWSSLAGYDTRVAKLVDANTFIPLEVIDANQSSSSESLKTADFNDSKMALLRAMTLP